MDYGHEGSNPSLGTRLEDALGVFVKSPKGRIFKREDNTSMQFNPGGVSIMETKSTYYIDDVETELEEFKRQMDIDGVPKKSPKKEE